MEQMARKTHSWKIHSKPLNRDYILIRWISPIGIVQYFYQSEDIGVDSVANDYTITLDKLLVPELSKKNAILELKNESDVIRTFAKAILNIHNEFTIETINGEEHSNARN